MSSGSSSTPSAKSGRLAALFHCRWAVPVLAELHGNPAHGRVAALMNRLGTGRESLRRALTALEELGLVGRNRGYGHPLRPEFVLSPAGSRLGPWAGEFLSGARRRGLLDLLLRKWSVPVLVALGEGGDRFSHLEAALPGITARALALSLKDLEKAGLVERRVTDGHPVAVRYRLSRRGRGLARLAGEVPT